MAFDDFCVKSRLTSFAFTLVYDWLTAHVASIADVWEVINLRTLSRIHELKSMKVDEWEAKIWEESKASLSKAGTDKQQ